MCKIIRGALLLLLLSAGLAHAADTGWLSSPNDDRARVRIQSALSGDETRALLQIELAPEWKTYWRSPGQGGFAPKISWNGTTQARWFWPTPSRFDISGLTTQGYKQRVTIPLVLNAPVSQPLSGTLTLPTCSNVCVLTDYPFTLAAAEPEDAQFKQAFARAMSTVPADRGVADTLSARWQNGELLISATSAAGWQDPAIFFDTFSSGAIAGEPQTEVSGSELQIRVPVTDEWGEQPETLSGENVSLVLSSGGKSQQIAVPVENDPPPGAAGGALWAILVMALAGGLILNLMPCVLPVLAMKLGSVLHAGSDRRRIRQRFLMTTAGILTSFAVLAALMTALKLSGLAPAWGIQFQNPWFIGFLVAVSFLFALNLMGLVRLFLPAALNSRLATAGGNGMAGSFFEGAFATLLATPCSAPFLGTAVAWALTSSLPELWLVFLTLGAGMSLPWLLVALIPRLAMLMPKPGNWMNALKTVLGLMMLASSLWLVTLLSTSIGQTFVAVASLVMVWLTLEAFFKTQQKNQRGALLLTAILAAAGGWQVHTLVDPTYVAEKSAASDSISWQPLTEEALSQALADNKKVLVDVTADWCITCKVNELRVLRRAEVIDALNQPDVVALRGDWSQPSHNISEFMQKRNNYAIPFNQVYTPGQPEPLTLPTLLDTSTLLNALKKDNR